MAKLADGSFYRVVSMVNGHTWLQHYQGASLQMAEKRFSERAGKMNELIDRLEIRLYQADGVSYRVCTTWRRDMNCTQIFTLLGRINHPKFMEKLYHRVSQRDYDDAHVATDEIMPLISTYSLRFCYNEEDGWAYWHEHECHCTFTHNMRGERVLVQSTSRAH
jgi:hypothetical protein